MTSTDQKAALVTGASRGIGYAMAKALAGEGYHIIAVARTVGGLEDLDDEIKAIGGSTTLVPLDLMDFDGIDRLGGAIHQKWGRLDAFLGNAGVLGQLSPLGHVEAKTWQNVMDLNVTANWRLIRSLNPLLQAAEKPRCVFLSSGCAHDFHAYWGPYSVSKAALEALVKTYAEETRSGKLKANLYSPGPVRTALRAKAMPGEDPMSLPTPMDVASVCLALFSDDLTSTGKVFEYQDGSLIEQTRA